MKPAAVIFRKRLLSYSETFIADQGRHLDRYRAVFCGFSADTSGAGLLGDSPRALLSEYSRFPELAKLAFRLGAVGNRAWLAALSGHAPGLVHAHFFKDGIDGLRLGQRLGVPVITTVHGHDITRKGNAEPGSRRTRRFFDRVDRVIAVSDFIAKQALARGCPESKLSRHYIGIDLDKFTQDKRESEHPSLLFVGRLVEKKGCTYLLQAMERLRGEFDGLSLTIIGDGHLRDSLHAEAESRGLAVHFVGATDAREIRAQLARSWIFVAPSVTAQSGDAEGLGMVFLEAQALQTPVVSFRSGGLVEAVEEDRTALLSDERDVNGLANNIADLLRDSQLRHNMGRAGRQRVERHFNLRRQCAALEDIYDKVR